MRGKYQAARADERITALDQRIASAEGPERQRLRAERAALWTEVLAQSRKEFADRFDAVHSVEHAVRVGSVSRIVAPASLRQFLIDAIERGIRKLDPTAPQRPPRPTSRRGWLGQSLADVPPDEQWLGEREHGAKAYLSVEPSPSRLTTRSLDGQVHGGGRLSVPPEGVEIFAASDGRPGSMDRRRARPASISLSHRGGRALAVVADKPAVTAISSQSSPAAAHTYASGSPRPSSAS